MDDLTDHETQQLTNEAWELVENMALVGVDCVVLRFGRGPSHYQYSEDMARRVDVPACLEHAARQIRLFLASRHN